jgi:hypothetical protein
MMCFVSRRLAQDADILGSQHRYNYDEQNSTVGGATLAPRGTCSEILCETRATFVVCVI